ncbi:MAG TPA: CHC2 zinc finger domain-containing protein, partial [Terriglobia bacterium]|nr:CHC2 zinc finger domain-containing protein [Terriglobia bacterium]
MNQVEDVRAAADIVKIVGDYVQLRKGGANMMGLCPFHQEKTPSFAV